MGFFHKIVPPPLFHTLVTISEVMDKPNNGKNNDNTVIELLRQALTNMSLRPLVLLVFPDPRPSSSINVGMTLQGRISALYYLQSNID